MKKLQRATQDLELVRLLADYSKANGLKAYDNAAIKAFGEDAVKSLTASVSENERIRGIRAESIFLAVVAGLGQVPLIKEEDSGDIFFQGDDVQPPDFRVVTHAGRQLLVEVKSIAVDVKGLELGALNKKMALKISDRQMQRLIRYAQLTGDELRFALFWENLQMWTLNKLDAFEKGIPHEKQWRLDLGQAMATNEMAEFGESTVGTVFPLRVRVTFVPGLQSAPMVGGLGRATLTINRMEMLSDEIVLRDSASRAIAWKLMCYGDWVETTANEVDDEGHILWTDFSYAPRDGNAGINENSSIVGMLSQLISRAYLAEAASTIHSSSTDELLQPGYMGQFIPEETGTLDLPLWVFRLQANYDF